MHFHRYMYIRKMHNHIPRFHFFDGSFYIKPLKFTEYMNLSSSCIVRMGRIHIGQAELSYERKYSGLIHACFDRFAVRSRNTLRKRNARTLTMGENDELIGANNS